MNGCRCERQLHRKLDTPNGARVLVSRPATNPHIARPPPTRGGLATSLNEIARASQVGIVLEEGSIPVRPAVQSACEMLGFDPLYVANEGKLIAIVEEQHTEIVMEAMRGERYGEESTIIGAVTDDPPGRVLMKTLIGSHRVVDELSGEMLPRIC